MKRFLLAFCLGAIAGVTGSLYLQRYLSEETIEEAQSQVHQGAARIKSTVQNTFSNLSSEAILEELAASGMVVRAKARQASQAILDATANARTTAAIKFKLVTESNLPGMRINVDTAGGLVTLSGTADSPEQVARAIRIALDTEGVSKVISTIQIQPQSRSDPTVPEVGRPIGTDHQLANSAIAKARAL